MDALDAKAALHELATAVLEYETAHTYPPNGDMQRVVEQYGALIAKARQALVELTPTRDATKEWNEVGG